MISCQDVELRLLELLGQDTEPELTDHIETCPACRAKCEDWARLWSLMDQWEEDKPSVEVESSILSYVHTDLEREATKKRKRSWKNIARTLIPLGAATAAALLAITLGVKKLGPVLQSLSPLALLTCGVIWAAIYMLMFLAAGRFGGFYRIKRVQLNVLARYALGALGIWISFSLFAELIGFQNFMQDFLHEIRPTGRYFVLGIIYAFIPLASLSILIRKDPLEKAPIHGVLIGFFFLFLLSPEILLYCGSFSAGMAVGWTIGTLVGCAAGGPLAVWLGSKYAKPSSV